MTTENVASLEVSPVTASRRAGMRRDRDVVVLSLELQGRALGLELSL
jgi:hypothetical protein